MDRINANQAEYERRIAELERERDHYRWHWDQAEALAVRYEKALREIEDGSRYWQDQQFLQRAPTIAHAALEDQEEVRTQ